MDTITHGIAGALIGKAFFSRRNARVATFAATVGAMFPDIDIIRYGFSSDPLAIVKYHRAITHSFVALPLFALLLAWLTCAGVGLLKPRFEKLRDLDSPSWPKLWLIYAIAIASHIILAVVALPMVLITFFFSLSGRIPQHRKIARWTFPLWLYVSVTGVITYVMLRLAQT